MPSWNGGLFSMNKIGPHFPAQPFAPSPFFCAWLELQAVGMPGIDRMPAPELMALHATWKAKRDKANAKWRLA